METIAGWADVDPDGRYGRIRWMGVENKDQNHYSYSSLEISLKKSDAAMHLQ